MTPQQIESTAQRIESKFDRTDRRNRRNQRHILALRIARRRIA